jgi:hypothetical protein
VEQLVFAWYAWLSSFTQGAVIALQAAADAVALPVAAAVLFGLIGALSPCQLTTNLGALAYATARPGETPPFRLALAYVAGKVSVYSLTGLGIVVIGLQLQSISIPVVIGARKALGPLMILIALGLAGTWRPRVTLGHRLAFRLGERLRLRGPLGAYLLGVAFAFAFCPTLFWLFFGLTVPLALRSAGGWSFAGLFALGSSLPLLAVAAVVGAGAGVAERVLGRLRHVERGVRMTAAVILLVAGLHDTVVYWLL